MASMRERSPGVWELRAYAGYQNGKRIQITRTFKGTEREAKKARDRLSVEVDERRAPTPGQGTVAGLFEEWHATHGWKSARSRAQARDDIDRYVIPSLGGIDLLRIADRDIDRLYAGLMSPTNPTSKRGKPLAPSTVRRLHGTIHAGFEWGVRKRRLRFNPATTANVPAVPPTTVTAPELAEVAAIIDAAPTPAMRAFLAVAAATGRRREDILGLQLPDFDDQLFSLMFARRVVYTPETGVIVEDRDKNNRANRISIDPQTAFILREHVWAMQARALPFGETLPRRAFIFSHDPLCRVPWHPDSTSRVFGKIRDKLGLPEITLHTLRHAHITELLTAGVDIETVAHRVGDDPQTIYRVYSHFRPVADRRASEAWVRIAHPVTDTDR